MYSNKQLKTKCTDMIKKILILFFAFGILSVNAQKKSDIVVTIGDTKVTKDEFEANYKKNNTNIHDEKHKKSTAENMDKYVNFRLKVIEAQELGYDTTKAFVSELKGYRKELAKPYMTNTTFTEQMVKNAYYRTVHERKASHILIRVTPEASPEDTLLAWNKANDIRNQIIAGADFGELAVKNSEDPSAAQNKGELGYFSAFQMVFPFEEMTYNTPVGQVSQIARTRFGYHIIKVEDERLSPGEMKVAHIMKMFPKQASDETIANLKLSADSVYQKVMNGEDFAELAKQYSDDKRSATEGGVMNWFSPTTMVPEFADAAFALKNNGDISPVIKSPYGWHIIKRIEYRTTEPFEKLKPELESKIKNNPVLSKTGDEAFEKNLKEEYKLVINDANFAKIIPYASDTIGKSDLEKLLSPIKDDVLVTFANQTINTAEFAKFLQTEKYVIGEKNQDYLLKTELNKLIHNRLYAYEDTQLETKHPDFARIYKEYHDGILLFNISKDKIWDVASTDTLRLQKYYDGTSKKYFWGDRFKGWVIETKDVELRTKIEPMLEKKDITVNEITDIFNTKTENNVQITVVAVEKGDNPVVDYYTWKGPKPAGFDETTTFVHGEIVSNEQKTLQDAWGLYSSDFQEIIEKEWIETLKAKYPVKINTKLLNKIPTVE